MPSIKPFAVIAAALCGVTLAGAPMRASNPVIGAPTTLPSGPPPNGVTFGEIPITSPSIGLSVESTKVKIHHVADAASISAMSNCPSHWNISGNIVRQVGSANGQKGVTLRADGFGAQVTLNGQLYQLPQDANGSIHSLKVENGVVTINGQPLQPLQGSNKPGAGGCTGSDALELSVPDSYSGGLSINLQGSSSVEVDSWKGGPLVARLNGNSTLTAGNLRQLEKVDIDVNGGGSASINSVVTKTLIANINGSGSVVVKGGSADISNATVSGTGMMSLKGKYKNLKKSVQGDGLIQVSE